MKGALSGQLGSTTRATALRRRDQAVERLLCFELRRPTHRIHRRKAAIEGLRRLVGWRRQVDELRLDVCAEPVHAVQHQAVKVNVETGCELKALDQLDRATLGLVGLYSRLLGGTVNQVGCSTASSPLKRAR